jgi:hypothetical protein
MDFYPLEAFEIERETDRAYGVTVEIECPNTNAFKTKLVWFPKSQIKDGKVPAWLLNAKIKEINEAVNPYRRDMLIDFKWVKMPENTSVEIV